MEEKNITFTAEIIEKREDQQLVFGWASVVEKDGKPVVDSQGDIISEKELEKAVYEFVLNCRKAGEMHISKDAGQLVECMVFTKEKQKALGIDLGKIGAWVGFKMTEEAFVKIKDGTYTMFSIGGKGIRHDA
jgi:hypothetical protein